MASKREKWERIQREEPELAELLRGMRARGMTIESLHYEPSDGALPVLHGWRGLVRVSPMGSVYLVDQAARACDAASAPNATHTKAPQE